jgi:ribosomal-protein-alanine N-acetyltransferase
MADDALWRGRPRLRVHGASRLVFELAARRRPNSQPGRPRYGAFHEQVLSRTSFDPMPLIAPNPIETPRLLVRLIAEADLPALMEVNGDDAVTRYVPYPTWQSFEDARAWFKRMSDLQAVGKALQFVVTTKATGKAIGTCLLFHFEDTAGSAELGYVLGQAHWGQGCMREALTALINYAFDQMSLCTVNATVDVRNVRSNRLLLGLGFVDAGLPHRHEIAKGETIELKIYRLHLQAWRSALSCEKSRRDEPAKP